MFDVVERLDVELARAKALGHPLWVKVTPGSAVLAMRDLDLLPLSVCLTTDLDLMKEARASCGCGALLSRLSGDTWGWVSGARASIHRRDFSPSFAHAARSW